MAQLERAPLGGTEPARTSRRIQASLSGTWQNRMMKLESTFTGWWYTSPSEKYESQLG